MKKVLLTAFLGFSSMAFSQELKDKPETKKTDKTLWVPADHAEMDAKKKAAEEKTRLPKPYDPKADAEKDIRNLLARAKKEKKNIMIQAGGNWCIWCLRFNNFVQTTPELKKIVDDNYLYYHLNYSPDNKNEKVFATYINVKDQQFYPFFIFLNEEGNKISVQQSDVLEEGKGYSLQKVKDFLEKWKPE